jgi:hypothetical protein
MKPKVRIKATAITPLTVKEGLTELANLLMASSKAISNANVRTISAIIVREHGILYRAMERAVPKCIDEYELWHSIQLQSRPALWGTVTAKDSVKTEWAIQGNGHLTFKDV